MSYLEPVPAAMAVADPKDLALAEMASELETQRSAGQAMLAAVKELDDRLAQQRERAGEFQERSELLEAQIVEYASAVTEQVGENKRLWCDLRLAEHRLAEELDKPGWRRLLGR